MTDKQQQAAAALFAEEWKGRGYEKGESQPFWMALLHNVYGVEHAEKYISFENQVKLSNTSFIDEYIEDTHVLIEQKAKIEQTAQAILDARALYPDSSLADLYDEVTMPPELRRAHQQNDRAVMEAYGFPVSRDFTESDCVARLFEMYKTLTQ